MPPKTRIPRERVEEAAFEIAREKGMSAITATGVAERLRCSTQPVYWWFGTMDSLKAAVRRRAGERYKSFLFQPVDHLNHFLEQISRCFSIIISLPANVDAAIQLYRVRLRNRQSDFIQIILCCFLVFFFKWRIQ